MLTATKQHQNSYGNDEQLSRCGKIILDIMTEGNILHLRCAKIYTNRHECLFFNLLIGFLLTLLLLRRCILAR